MKLAHLVPATALVLGTLLAPAAQAADPVKLNVYTALEDDQVKAYKDAFEKDNPGIEIVWTRDSTGVVLAKLLAEKANPQADVVWGLAASSLVALQNEGMLAAYAPKGVETIPAQFKDKATPPSWVGMDVWAATICFNTVEAEKRHIPKPATWADLTKDVYKGTIVMPNPASSGTGYLDVSAWLQMFGEDGGWKYMDGLHKNILSYTHSGSKPCNMAGAGEAVIGISFEYRASTVKSKGAPVDLVFPTEGLGWDMEATSILKTTKHQAEAQKLADWAITKQANTLYAKSYAIVALPGVAQPLPGLPADYEKHLAKIDLGWAATNRDRILTEWNKRYNEKSEPKKS